MLQYFVIMPKIDFPDIEDYRPTFFFNWSYFWQLKLVHICFDRLFYKFIIFALIFSYKKKLPFLGEFLSLLCENFKFWHPGFSGSSFQRVRQRRFFLIGSMARLVPCITTVKFAFPLKWTPLQKIYFLDCCDDGEHVTGEQLGRTDNGGSWKNIYKRFKLYSYTQIIRKTLVGEKF